jgi:uncharacterized protein YecE (DUF72 family)
LRAWVGSAAKHARLHLGTSAFTAAGWEGGFYPAGMKPRDFLTHYATKFDTAVDRRRELSEWARLCGPIMRRGVVIFAYANNHYAGHGPATVAQFLELWKKLKP